MTTTIDETLRKALTTTISSADHRPDFYAALFNLAKKECCPDEAPEEHNHTEPCRRYDSLHKVFAAHQFGGLDITGALEYIAEQLAFDTDNTSLFSAVKNLPVGKQVLKEAENRSENLKMTDDVHSDMTESTEAMRQHTSHLVSQKRDPRWKALFSGQAIGMQQVLDAKLDIPPLV